MPSGRSLGIYEEHEKTEEERRRRQRQEEQAGVERVDVFGMHLKAVQVGAGAARRPAWCLIAPRADLPGGTAGSCTCGQWVGCTAPMHTHPTRARARALACTHTSVPSWCAHLAPPPGGTPAGGQRAACLLRRPGHRPQLNTAVPAALLWHRQLPGSQGRGRAPWLLCRQGHG